MLATGLCLVLSALVLGACTTNDVADRVLLGPEASLTGTPIAVASASAPTPLPSPTAVPIKERALGISLAHLSVRPATEQKITVMGTPLTYINLFTVYSNGIYLNEGTRIGAQIDTKGEFVLSWDIDRFAPGGRVTVRAQLAGTSKEEVAFFVIDAPTWPNPASEVVSRLPTQPPGPMGTGSLASGTTTPSGAATALASTTARAGVTPSATVSQLTFRTWADTLTFPSGGGSETIHGQLTDAGGRGAENGRLYAIGQFPNGRSEVWLSDRPTDATGATTVTFSLPAVARGGQVNVDVYMTQEGRSYTGHLTLTAR